MFTIGPPTELCKIHEIHFSTKSFIDILRLNKLLAKNGRVYRANLNTLKTKNVIAIAHGIISEIDDGARSVMETFLVVGDDDFH